MKTIIPIIFLIFLVPEVTSRCRNELPRRKFIENANNCPNRCKNTCGCNYPVAGDELIEKLDPHFHLETLAHYVAPTVTYKKCDPFPNPCKIGDAWTLYYDYSTSKLTEIKGFNTTDTYYCANGRQEIGDIVGVMRYYTCKQ